MTVDEEMGVADQVSFANDADPERVEHAIKRVAPGGLDRIAELDEDEDDYETFSQTLAQTLPQAQEHLKNIGADFSLHNNGIIKSLKNIGVAFESPRRKTSFDDEEEKKENK